jgi:hypothetical protein
MLLLRLPEYKTGSFLGVVKNTADQFAILLWWKADERDRHKDMWIKVQAVGDATV